MHAQTHHADRLIACGLMATRCVVMASRLVENCTCRIFVMMETIIQMTGAQPCAQWNADTHVMVDWEMPVIYALQIAATGSVLVTRHATTATRPTAMAATAPVALSLVGTALTQTAGRRAVLKCAEIASKRLARDVMMETLPLVTGARTCAALSVALFAMRQSPKSVSQSAETESVPVTRHVMTATLLMTMVATATVTPQSLDGSAKPRQLANKQDVKSVQRANLRLEVCVRIARQARTCPQREAPPQRTVLSVRRASIPTTFCQRVMPVQIVPIQLRKARL
jgi:hypothetical protein